MTFNINVWRSYYDKVHAIGAIVKKNIHDHFENGVCDLSKNEIAELTKKADAICKASEHYMTANGINRPPVLWTYKVDDVRTHASNPAFIYYKLIDRTATKC